MLGYLARARAPGPLPQGVGGPPGPLIKSKLKSTGEFRIFLGRPTGGRTPPFDFSKIASPSIPIRDPHF